MRQLAPVVLCVLLLGMAGCGGNDATPTTDAPTSTATIAPTTTTTVAPTTTVPPTTTTTAKPRPTTTTSPSGSEPSTTIVTEF